MWQELLVTFEKKTFEEEFEIREISGGAPFIWFLLWSHFQLLTDFPKNTKQKSLPVALESGTVVESLNSGACYFSLNRSFKSCSDYFGRLHLTSVWGEFLYLLNGKTTYFIAVNTDSVSGLCYLLINYPLKHSVLHL